MKQYYSILNDVLGPIMTGPSSSHSAGCARIGRTARLLWGREIMRADVVFEERGSYPGTYIGQGSDFGFTGGLLGYLPDDERLKNAVRIARESGRKITFKKESLGFRHPNQAEIRVYDEDGKLGMTLMTYSVGGGMFEIDRMDGFSVEINGGCDYVFVLCECSSALTSVLRMLDDSGRKYRTESSEGGTLVTVKPVFDDDISDLLRLSEINGVKYVRHASPVLDVVRREAVQMPFYNAGEALAYHKQSGRRLWEMAIDYECAIGYITAEEVLASISRVAAIMERSTVAPDPKTTAVTGFLPYTSGKMTEEFGQRRTVDAGILNKAMLAAVSVMENSCAHNIIVAAPTAGSSGVVPAAIVTLGRGVGASDEEIAHGLLAAGVCGAFIANQATFGGEVGACQAENGSASAMAAAGIVTLLRGSVEEAFRAADIALQNMLGLICDPVAGLTEIPCISRNVAALSNAVMSANMAVSGFDPVIPLDETILTMKKVGEMLPAELRCTCCGGLCKTATGMKITDEIEKKRPKL